MIDLTILMDTQLGRPADMLEAAEKGGVDIIAACIFPRLGGRVAHLAVDASDVAAVRRVVGNHGGVVADERECVVVPPGRDGGIAGASRAVSDAGVLVTIAYYGRRGELILGASDVDGARAALGL
jgi:hypothetical protein